MWAFQRLFYDFPRRSLVLNGAEEIARSRNDWERVWRYFFRTEAKSRRITGSLEDLWL
ncbi:hypothetical protein [Calothrix sp. PCC 6303]|uniref:hypothetical protein n=1 Tax=Calothrix sp. PCC 6303 TaxID=1170562 RepID=UPI0002E5F4E8|nr:hypothetical protein [Calothrix sp. PCC 6303]